MIEYINLDYLNLVLIIIVGVFVILNSVKLFSSLKKEKFGDSNLSSPEWLLSQPLLIADDDGNMSRDIDNKLKTYIDSKILDKKQCIQHILCSKNTYIKNNFETPFTNKIDLYNTDSNLSKSITYQHTANTIALQNSYNTVRSACQCSSG